MTASQEKVYNSREHWLRMRRQQVKYINALGPDKGRQYISAVYRLQDIDGHLQRTRAMHFNLGTYEHR